MDVGIRLSFVKSSKLFFFLGGGGCNPQPTPVGTPLEYRNRGYFFTAHMVAQNRLNIVFKHILCCLSCSFHQSSNAALLKLWSSGSALVVLLDCILVQKRQKK
jgi:hypothetical protein